MLLPACPRAAEILNFADHQLRLVLPGGLVKLLQRIRLDQVIGIQKVEIFSCCLLNPPIARGGNPSVFLTNRPDKGVFFAIFPQDLRRAVGGAVIHHKHLNLPQCLNGQAVEGFSQILLRIIGRNHNGYFWRQAATLSFPSSDKSVKPAYNRKGRCKM